MPIAERAWQLTPEQIEAQWSHVLGRSVEVEADLTAIRGFDRRFTSAAHFRDLTEVMVGALTDHAHAATMFISEDPSALDTCWAEGDDPLCAEQTIGDLLSRAFRRPANSEELGSYLDAYEDAKGWMSSSEALALVTEAALLSPNLLLRLEIADSGSLSQRARADALAFFLLDGPPDEELLDAAEADALTSEGMQAQAERITSGVSAPGLIRFLRELFGYDAVHRVSAARQAEFYPDWDEELRNDLVEESDRFVSIVLQDYDGSLEALFSSRDAEVTPRLAEYYGVDHPTGAGWARVVLPEPRAGILTRGAFTARYAHPWGTDVVHRGLFVRSQLLCHDLQLPSEVDVVPPPRDPSRTQRERLDEEHSISACASCHSLMDPLGYAFERFDADGRVRDLENGEPVNSSGQLSATTRDGSFETAAELSSMLATHPEVADCLTLQMQRFALGLGERGQATCDANDPAAALRERGSLLEAARLIVGAESFVQRASQP